MATSDLNRFRKLAAAVGVGSLLVFGTTACDDPENNDAPAEQQEAPAPDVEDGIVDEGMDGGADEGGLDDTDDTDDDMEDD